MKTFSAYDEPFRARRHFETERRPDYNRGRFGERAEYDYDEPRYGDYRGSFRDEGRRSSLYDLRGDLSPEDESITRQSVLDYDAETS